MPIRLTPIRPALLLLGAAATLSLAAAPADAATRKLKAKPLPDLTIRQLEVDVSDEGTLLVSGNLLNLGRKVARSSDVVIAISDDDELDDSDEVLDEVTYSRVAPGARRSIDDEVDVPDDVDTSEDLNVLVCADGYDDILERNEDNNCSSATVSADDLAALDDGSDDGGETDPADDGQ